MPFSLAFIRHLSLPPLLASTNPVNRGYWDPEESTRAKWETTYASELQSRGLTQDFTGLSELLLGQAQPAQFQSADQTSYYWGSKILDDGDFTYSDSNNAQTMNNRRYSEMPRSYDGGKTGYENFYNWYAAVAESGGYATETTASDSLCPSGWMLPVASDGNDDNEVPYKSWYNLLIGSYGLTENQDESSLEARKAPLTLSLEGYYQLSSSDTSQLRNLDISGHMWTSDSRSSNVSSIYLRLSDPQQGGGNVLNPRYYNGFKSFGFSVRCVLR